MTRLSVHTLISIWLLLFSTTALAASSTPGIQDYRDAPQTAVDAFNEGDYESYLTLFDFREIARTHHERL